MLHRCRGRRNVFASKRDDSNCRRYLGPLSCLQTCDKLWYSWSTKGSACTYPYREFAPYILLFCQRGNKKGGLKSYERCMNLCAIWNGRLKLSVSFSEKYKVKFRSMSFPFLLLHYITNGYGKQPVERFCVINVQFAISQERSFTQPPYSK
jgi:hypothetical protein